MLGSPTQEEYDILAKKVPYDPKLFKDFPRYKRDIPTFMGQFYSFEDTDNLQDLLLKMFEYIPERRITAREALEHPFFSDIQKDYCEMMGKN